MVDDSNVMKAVIHYNLAIVFHKINHVEKAIFYGEMALQTYLANNKWKNVVKTYNLLGVLYIEKRRFPSAKNSLTKALEIEDHYRFEQLKQRIYHNFAVLYKNSGFLKESEGYYLKALELKGRSNSTDIIFTYRSLIDLHMEMNQYKQAGDLLIKAQEIVESSVQIKQLKLLEAQLDRHFGNDQLYEQKTKEAIDFLYCYSQWKTLKYECIHFADYLRGKRRYREAADFYRMETDVRENLDRGDNHEETNIDPNSSSIDSSAIYRR